MLKLQKMKSKKLKKFKQVNLDIDFVKDKKLYKLVYFAVNEKLAKSICDFSKDIKVSCLVKKMKDCRLCTIIRYFITKRFFC